MAQFVSHSVTYRIWFFCAYGLCSLSFARVRSGLGCFPGNPGFGNGSDGHLQGGRLLWFTFGYGTCFNMWSLGRVLEFINPGLRSFPPCSGPVRLLSVGCSRFGKGGPGPCYVQSSLVTHNWILMGMAGVACRAAGASCAGFEWARFRYGRVGLPLQAWLV